MAVTVFDGVDDAVHTGIGAMLAPGPVSGAAWYKKNADGVFHALLGLHDAGGLARGAIELRSTGNTVAFNNGGSGSFSTTTVTVADGWVLIAVTKASGSVAPRFHIKKQTGPWVHENGSLALADAATAAGGTMRFGEWQGVDDANGRMARAAWWNVELSDAQVENLYGDVSRWLGLSPAACWDFNATPLVDLTGGGADETARTGTALIDGDDPAGLLEALALPRSSGPPGRRPARGPLSFLERRFPLGGSTAQLFTIELAAEAPSAAALQAQANATRTSTAPGAVALRRDVSAARSVAAPATATVRRSVAATRSVSAPASVSLLAMKTKLLTLAVSVVTVVSLVRQPQKPLTAGAPGAVSVVKRPAKTLAVTAGATATVAAIKTKLVTLAVSSAAVVSVARRVNATRAVTVTTVPVLSKAAVRVFAAVVSATVATLVKQAQRARSVASATVVALARLPHLVRAVTVTVTVTVRRALTVTFQVAAPVVVALVKRPARTLAAAVSAVADLVPVPFNITVPVPNLLRPLRAVFMDRRRARPLDTGHADELDPGAGASPLEQGAADELDGLGGAGEV